MTGPLRIAVVCYPALGGSGVVASELALALATRGHRVDLVATALPDRLRSTAVRFQRIDVPSSPVFEHAPYGEAVASRLIELARREPVDLVHLHYAVPHAASGLLAAQALGAAAPAMVVTLHGTDVTALGSHPSLRAVTTFALDACAGLTTPSHYLRGQTVDHFGIAADRIEVIANFVDLERFAPPARRDRAQLASLFDPTGGLAPRPTGQAGGVPTPHRLAPLVEPSGDLAPRPTGQAGGVPTPHRLAPLVEPSGAALPERSGVEGKARRETDGGPVLFHVSNFRPIKRPLDLIEVLARVRKALPARLVLVGDGPERAATLARAHERGVADAVCSLGRRRDFAGLLAHADGFLLTSESESFGVAALEAMASGVPVFGYRVGGVPEVVGEDAGTLVAFGDVDALAGAVIAGVGDRRVHGAMAEAARARAETLFSMNLAVERYEIYFRHVLERRASATAGVMDRGTR